MVASRKCATLAMLRTIWKVVELSNPVCGARNGDELGYVWTICPIEYYWLRELNRMLSIACQLRRFARLAASTTLLSPYSIIMADRLLDANTKCWLVSNRLQLLKPRSGNVVQ